jgi:peptide/nickel transport system permease protein
MISYFIRKFFYGSAVMLGIVVVVFFLFNVLPVDPARMTQGQRADVQSLQAIRKEFGLDKPVPVQFLYYINDLSAIGFHLNTKEEQQKYHYIKLFPVSSSRVAALKWPYLRRSYQTHKEVAKLLMEVIPNTLVLATTAMIFAILIGVFFGVLSAVHQNTWMDKLAIGFSTL